MVSAFVVGMTVADVLLGILLIILGLRWLRVFKFRTIGRGLPLLIAGVSASAKKIHLEYDGGMVSENQIMQRINKSLGFKIEKIK